jgi:hypothetical protein
MEIMINESQKGSYNRFPGTPERNPKPCESGYRFSDPAIGTQPCSCIIIFHTKDPIFLILSNFNFNMQLLNINFLATRVGRPLAAQKKK